VAISPSKNAQQRDEGNGNDEFETIVFPLALDLPQPLDQNGCLSHYHATKSMRPMVVIRV
jgi:hypothetical protein